MAKPRCFFQDSQSMRIPSMMKQSIFTYMLSVNVVCLLLIFNFDVCELWLYMLCFYSSVYVVSVRRAYSTVVFTLIMKLNSI